jgi:methyl-accepting chemotaxis protein
VSSIKRVSTLNAEIAGATKEQSVGLAQVSRAIGDFELSSVENQKSMDQVSGASENLHSQVQMLEEIITNLEREVRGSAPTP